MPVEKRNIFLHETQHALPYISKRKRSGASFPCRENPKAHAAFILQKLEACRQQDYDQKQVAAIRHKEGIYLEFSGAAGYDLLTKSFDNYSSGIRLLNVREDGQDDEKIVRATVYVPAEKTTYFLDKIQSYSESLDTLEAGQNPKNDSLVRSIEDVKLALLEAFWVGKVEDIPSDVPAWCEIWLRYEKSDHAAAEQDLSTCCEEFGIELNSKCIVFPERVVRLVRGTRTQLSMLLEGCNYLAEIRRAQEPTSFFDELTGSEQKEWVNDLLSRTEFHPSSASVCILDTGIMYSHPLLQPAIDENNVQAVNDQWGKNDHNGHGTEMAGVALYYDLKDKLSTSDTVDVYHHLESVKILPPHGENDPDLYGAVTGQAVSLAEISNPNANRSITFQCQLLLCHFHRFSDSLYMLPQSDCIRIRHHHHLNSIVSFLRKERYNIIVPAILSYCADFCVSRSSYKKTVTRPGDFTRYSITVAVCGGNCDFLLG